MSDATASLSASTEAPAGEVAMARLAQRISSMVPAPTPALAAVPAVSMPRAASSAAALAALAAERARRSRSITGLLVDGFVAACACIPYALVALVLRLAMARAFFLDGQSRILGPRLPLNIQDFSYSLTLPAAPGRETVAAIAAGILPSQLPPEFVAQALVWAEFALPIMLVLGIGTRFAAVGLLAVTLVMQFVLAPQLLWSAHVYWAAILLVLVSLGGGMVSIDAAIRALARR